MTLRCWSSTRELYRAAVPEMHSLHCLSDFKGFLMGAVGANQWKGGFLKYRTTSKRMESVYPSDIDPDSYLGRVRMELTTVKSSFNGQSKWLWNQWQRDVQKMGNNNRLQKCIGFSINHVVEMKQYSLTHYFYSSHWSHEEEKLISNWIIDCFHDNLCGQFAQALSWIQCLVMWPLAYNLWTFCRMQFDLDLRLLHGSGTNSGRLFDNSWRSEISTHWYSDSSPDI